MFNNSFKSYIRIGMRFRRTAYVSGVLLFLLILATLCPVYLVPEVAEAATKDANPATLTYNATSSAASVSLNVTDLAGNFATSGSNELASFSLATNNATGYTLNLKTSGDTTSLSDGTNSIATISSATTSSNFSNNTWGLLPSKYNGTANTTNYYPASTTGFKMDETSTANSTANTYTVGLGIKVNHNTPAGTYTNSTIIAEYVANAVTYSINYYTNTSDTITGMPSTNPQTGTVSQGTISTSVTLASAPSRTGYTFVGWCKGTNTSTSNITIKTDGTPDVCSTTTYTAGQSFGIDATRSPDTYYLFAMWQRISFTITRQYKLQDTAGNYPSTYTADTDATVLYGDSYTYSIAATSSHQAASTTITNVTSAQTLSLDVPRVHVTCNTQFRYEDQNGGFSSYTSDTATWAYYGGSCSYSKSEQYYRGSTSAANDTTATASASNVTSTTTLSVTLYRNVYNLTVTAGTNTSSPTGGGSKRWGQVVQVSVTKTANVTCTSYAAPSWSQGSASGTIGSTSNNGNVYYMNYTMPKSAATVTASSTASNVAQNITLTRTGGASSITIGGTTYTSSPASLNCGTYNISGSYDSGYEFSSWAASGSVTLGSSTTTASNTITVSGSGTLTLTGKSLSVIAFQSATSANCGSNMYDNRGTNAYKSIVYGTASINNLCWTTRDLDLPGGTTLTSSDSNVLSNFTLPASSTSGFNSTTTAFVYNSGSTVCSNTSDCYSYYNYYAANVGTSGGTEDICPKGWRLPTKTELDNLIITYNRYSLLAGSPFYATSGGYYVYGSNAAPGHYHGYWSSTDGYYLEYETGDGIKYKVQNGGYGKVPGYGVRCVAKS